MAEYSVLYPTNDIVKYTSATPDLQYIKNDIETLFGPINAPKLYAQELDALELASSGKIAFTLSNSHSLDLVSDGTDVSLRARDSLSLVLVTESSNVSIKLDETTDSLEAVATSNVELRAGSDVVIEATHDVFVGASNHVSLAAPSVVVAASNIDLAASNLDIAASNLDIASEGVAVVAADVSVQSETILQTATSTIRIGSADVFVSASKSLETTASNILIGASDAISLTASNSLAIDSEDVAIGAVDLALRTSNDMVVAAQSNLIIEAGLLTSIESETLVVTSSDTATFASSNKTAILSEYGDVVVKAASNLALEALAGDVFIRAPNNRKTVFEVGGANILELYRTEFFDTDSACNLTDYKFRINADLEILGTTNSVSVNETTLNVENRVVHLAFNSNIENPYDGTTNDGAGIMVDGMPESGDPAIYDRYEKSIKWFHSANGVPALGGNDISGESFWNVRGGGLRITQVDEANGDQVAFGFRINALHELEIYKMVTPNGGVPATARVAKLGRSSVP